MSQKQYVVFKLDEQSFGINILSVKEIAVAQEITIVPTLEKTFEGIISMRGKIVPIVNLKSRLEIKGSQIKGNRIIVCNLDEKEIGFMVDDASQVITLKDDDVDCTPEIMNREDKNYIVGIGKLEDKIIIILDLIKVLTGNEKENILESAI